MANCQLVAEICYKWHGRQCLCTLVAIRTCPDFPQFAVPLVGDLLLPVCYAFFVACLWSVTLLAAPVNAF